jgi:hypothetical protein
MKFLLINQTANKKYFNKPKKPPSGGFFVPTMKVVKNSERLFLNDCPISVGGNKTYPPVVKNTLPPTTNL